MQNKAKTRSFKRRFRCVLTAILILLMTFTTLPVEAFAEEDYDIYGLMIAGVCVTEENASDVLGNGVFSYNHSIGSRYSCSRKP